VVIIECCNAHPALPDFEDDTQFPPDAKILTGPEWIILSMP
jgi:hypothetical protein